MTRRLLGFGTLALFLAAGVAAWAYWSATGIGAASASTAALAAATISAPASATNAVTLAWSEQASLVPSGSDNSQITYTVQRRLGSGSYADVASGGCSGPKPFDTASCSDSPPGAGSYSYRVVASYHSWTATSDDTSAVAVTIDTTAPVVQSITRLDADPSNAATLRWTVTFSESVTGVGPGDFSLARGGTLSGGTVGSVTGSGTTYVVTASTGSGSGALGLNLVDDDSIADAGANPLGGAGVGNGNLTGQTYTMDLTAPTAATIVRASADPTNAASVQWTVTFSEPVTGVDSADFTLRRTGALTGGAITAVTGSGTTYTVTASTGAGTGTLGLDLTDDDTIVDALGNRLGGTGTGNGNLSGQTYSVDRTAPSVSSITTANANPTNAATVSWTVTFSEIVSGVDAADFALARTGTVSASAAIQSVTGSGTTRTVTATTVSGQGTLGLNLAANGTVVDQVGNALSSSFTGQTYTIDRTAPIRTAMSMSDVNANGKIDRVTVTFSESLASSTATAPWTLTNVPSGGTLASVSTSGTTATLTLNEGAGAANTAVGTFTVALAASASGIRDPAGNQASFAAAAPSDLAAPRLTSLQMFDLNTNGKIDYVTAAFSETLVSSTATAPWTLANVPSGGTLASVSTSGTIAYVTLTEGAGAANTAVGSFTVALAASATGIRDSAGNQSSFAATAPADKAKPVPVSVSDTNGATDGRIETGNTFVATFSEAIAPASLPSSTPITESGAGTNDTFTIGGFTNGALDMGSATYVNGTAVVTFAGTSVLSGGGLTITTTVGACSANCADVRTGTSTSMTYVPAPTLLDAAGNAAAGPRSTGFRIF